MDPRAAAPSSAPAREERSDPRGHTTVERLAPTVARFTTTGFLSDDLARFALDRNAVMLRELAAAAGRVDVPSFTGFYDWGAMTGYSPVARAESTTFIVAHRKQFRAVVILVGSPIVAMAVNVANLVVGGVLQATTSRPEFEDRLQRALHGG